MSRKKTAVKNFFDRVAQKLEGTPGIEAVAVSSGAPLAPGRPSSQPFFIQGRPTGKNEARPVANVEVATPDSFRLLGVPLISGRFFTPQDSAEAPTVVIVHQGFPRHNFPNKHPRGNRTSSLGKNCD